MRITILTIGSRGDVQPYIALGRGLLAAGHRVTLATHASFEGAIREHGLGFAPVAGDPNAILASESGLDWLESGQNTIALFQGMVRNAKPFLLDALKDMYSACQGTDLVLSALLPAFAGHSIAEKLGCAFLPAYLQHVRRTQQYPSMGAPYLHLGGLYNQLSYLPSSHLFWQLIRPITNRWRQETLNLAPYPFKGPFVEWTRRPIPVIYGFSEHVIPKAPDWPAEDHITGYWHLEEKDWQPPDELVRFLESGPPPVYVGFGSLRNRDPKQVTEQILQALHKNGQRGVLASGWGGIEPENLPEWAFCIGSAPHDWLFSKMAAVVHHGGAGTTAAGLRAGIPTVTIPCFADQFFGGWRVHELGVGAQPIARKKFSADKLAQAIQQVTADRALCQRAKHLGELLRAENGVAKAVEIVERYFIKKR